MSFNNFAKLWRFARLYGPCRALFKTAGRLRDAFPLKPLAKQRVRRVGIVGCGQFAFSTIAYFLRRFPSGGIRACFDVDSGAANSFARLFGVESVYDSAAALINDPDIEILYISSNHSSHTQYAIEALRAGLIVYVEKPVSVNFDQFFALRSEASAYPGRIFSGYNRPFSPAISKVRRAVGFSNEPMTLSCFVSGHKLDPDHWYRDRGEGTRICGNVGHWLDLAVHMLCWGDLPDKWRIRLHWADAFARDDNLAISMSSTRGDLVSIVLTARAEPFEGINETINYQQGATIAKIDDFRLVDIWNGSGFARHRFWPKDVGHKNAIAQPFEVIGRPWREVELSTVLMLTIARMVEEGVEVRDFAFSAFAAEGGSSI